MFCIMCLDGNDKNETALRGLNSSVFNSIYFNRVQYCENFFSNYPGNLIAERNFAKCSDFRSS